MKICNCFYYIVFCVEIVPYLSAKPVSLNKLIEEEEKNIQSRRQERIKPEIGEKVKLRNNEPLASKLAKVTRTGIGSFFSQDRTKSPLHYRKEFQIRSPLKPRRVKLFPRLNKLKNPTTKRDTNHYGSLNEKYIPLLRNIGLLFDNILGPDSGDYGTGEHYRDNADESEEVVCTCASKQGNAKTVETRQKTAASSRVIAIEVATRPSEIASTSANNPAYDNVSSVRRNKNIPLLLTRNTTSFRRNNTRLRERSNTPHFRSTERHITGPCGNNECDTRVGEIEPFPEDDEENTNSDTRDDARSDGSDARRNRHYTRNRGVIRKSEVPHKPEPTTDKTTEGSRRHLSQHEREDQFKVRGDEAESTSVLSKSDSGLREFDSYEETEVLQTTETYEGATSGQDSGTTDQQLSERNGEDTAEDQKFCGTDEAVTNQLCGTIKTVTLGKSANSPAEKFAMIYDGYSVVHDVNGKNTLTEKAITIHS